jgi:ferredoxin
VEACPYDSIRLLGVEAGIQLYTPYIDPLLTPCYLCMEREGRGPYKPIGDFLRCGKACPTGAIRAISTRMEELGNLPKPIKTGIAKLDRNLCVAWQFEFCSDCYQCCPLKDKAILPKPPDEMLIGGGIRPYVNEKACMGCGVCAYVCPVRKSFADSKANKSAIPSYSGKYKTLVRKILDKNGKDAELPAIRVVRI